MKVALYKGRTRLFDRVVQWWLRGRYSHCELVIAESDGLSHCLSSSIRDGGVRAKWMQLDPAKWDVIDVPDSPHALPWFEAHDADGYDVLGLLGFVWRRQRGDKARWFCSEAVAAMLGIPEPWRFDPCALSSALILHSKTRRAP